jgi:hypothetical protein
MVRQLRLLEQVAAGAVEAGEATLYEIASHRGDHRSESAMDRRLIVKMAVWLARHDGTAIDLARTRRYGHEPIGPNELSVHDGMKAWRARKTTFSKVLWSC